jgi:hypothetical protein
MIFFNQSLRDAAHPVLEDGAAAHPVLEDGAAARPVLSDGAAARPVLSDGAAAHPVLEDVGRDAAHQVRVFFSLCPLSFWLSFSVKFDVH